MKLHLPVFLRRVLFACFSLALGDALLNSSTAYASVYVLEGKESLVVDYAEADSLINLSGGVLQLRGETYLQLSNCGENDGRVYTLMLGVSELLDATGTPIVLDSDNNAVSLYFDKTRPGTGFWSNARLQLDADGTLKLVRHDEDVADAVVVSSRQTDGTAYQFCSGVEYSGCGSYQSSGGALSVNDGSTIGLKDNGYVCFKENVASAAKGTYGTFPANGGAIYVGKSSTITLQGNGHVSFSDNKTKSDVIGVAGGAIYGDEGSSIDLSDNGSVAFIGNKGEVTGSTKYSSPTSGGGAINGASSSHISLKGNGSVVFKGNEVTTITSGLCDGGAIYGESGSTIELNENGEIEFVENRASRGGAISGTTVTLGGNESVKFTQNSASGSGGGAINGSLIALSNNGSVSFSKNTGRRSKSDSYATPASVATVALGGALAGTTTLSRNGTLFFKENSIAASAVSYYTASAEAYGGAVAGSTVLSLNEVVEFSGNHAEATSYSRGYSNENSHAYGGAMYGKTIELLENKSVEFKENTVYSSSGSSYAYGGAIYSDGSLSIIGNSEVTFARNCEKNESVYRLRSIYLKGGNSSSLVLSAKTGGYIRFCDSIYVGASGAVQLNMDYQDSDDVLQKAGGDIVFSGATTENDLKDAKGGVAGTTSEILNSRTSVINCTTTLYGGTLRVEDKAVLKTHAINIVADSKAVMKVSNAEVNAQGYDIMVNKTGTLLLEGLVVDETIQAALLSANNITISSGAELAVKAITVNAAAPNQSAAFTLDSRATTGYDANRAFNVLKGGEIDAALLTLTAGATYTANAANMGLSEGELTLAITTTATKKIELNLTLSADYDPAAQVVLFSDVATVNFIRDGITAKSTDGVVYTLSAADYFSGASITGTTSLVYDSANKVVYLEGVANVPEPTSSMLGLVGLVALTFRRRRK